MTCENCFNCSFNKWFSIEFYKWLELELKKPMDDRNTTFCFRLTGKFTKNEIYTMLSKTEIPPKDIAVNYCKTHKCFLVDFKPKDCYYYPEAYA